MARRIPAVFMRGGSSKAVMFNASDLPESREERDALFLELMGSPDPYQRQLNGMGGGISSVSKVVIVEPSARDDADVDYTFGQVTVDKPIVDYSATCGNMSSAVAPFAIDERLVDVVADGTVTVRVFNTNTSKLYHAELEVKERVAVEVGDFTIPGVAGSGALTTLSYLDPGGAATGKFLPSGNTVDELEVPGLGAVEMSLVDASNPIVFVEAARLGKTATERPEALDSDGDFMAKMEAIRRVGAVAMGLADSVETVKLANPKIAILGPAADFESIDGASHKADNMDICVRIVSMEKVHRAVTLTGAMCLAAAAEVPGTIANRLRRAGAEGAPLRIGNASGVLPAKAEVRALDEGGFEALSVTTYRTFRRLMEGNVLVR